MKGSWLATRSTVSPCLLVENIQSELQFLKTVFGVEISGGRSEPEGTMWQTELQLGDATILIGRAHKGAAPSSGILYVWTDDVDAIYTRAMEAGAALISAPSDLPSGVREAGFKDPQGNVWWVGRRLKKMSNREVERRLSQQRRARL